VPALEVDHDREDVAVVHGLDLPSIVPEAPAHVWPGSGLDLDVDQERAVVRPEEGDLH